ncbi:tRNA pseudouridine(38/39) synthase [Pseudozyma hubeiensis]|nr:tRNA pseudouridine(38/39) synthase [Pseudozyma hubeiensis]
MEIKDRYRSWTKDSLISRIAELEAQTKSQRAIQAGIDTAAFVERTSPDSKKKGIGKKEKKSKEVDFASAGCRKIALRFSYDGAGYSGLAAQNGEGAAGSSLPTVEGVLWEALCTARLVDAKAGMDGAGFSRCGRTDRGVSAAGQVVALWVRSRKLNQWEQRLTHQEQFSLSTSLAARPSEEEWKELEEKRNSKLEEQELPYVQILNRILPGTIRIQAWSPVRSDFSSRFDCVYRHYKYFFPSGPPNIFYPPTTTTTTNLAIGGGQDAGATRLDIDLMRDAASRLLGEHDFRNLCKIDASKQITNFRRRIDGVSIDRVSSHWPSNHDVVPDDDDDGEKENMYVLNLRGTAFLYHQVRNIMAILFLVGARLESPSIVEELMNVSEGRIAADRVQMRLAAETGTRATANADPPSDNEEGLKWWLPVNATPSSHRNSTPTGLPMWMHTALSTTPSDFARSDAELEIYATKPNYEMAADRPLVLWECGFLPSDIEWRVGAYDGPLSSISPTEQQDNNVSASNSLLRVHKTWTQMAVSTELSRHFVLASPSAKTGTLASRTNFGDAAFPCLETTRNERRSKEEETRKERLKSGVIPLGNGTGRGAMNYVPLGLRPREETYEVKNRRWAETTGKRRADRKAEQQQQQQVNAGESGAGEGDVVMNE